MPTQRGFVEALEIGRAGLASAFLLHGDGSRATYTIADLDADPERFNERLSQLGLLRDAMDRAEPVEIEFDGENDGGAITRVRRLTRDALEQPRETDRVSGLVVGVKLEIINRPDAPEPSDRATLVLLVGSAIESYVIEMQTPERTTAAAMVDTARSAQATGGSVTIDFDVKQRTVLAIECGGDEGVGGGSADEDVFAGFVESIGHTPASEMMAIDMTTAPPFSADGNYVELVPFVPDKRSLLVVRGAPEYALFEAALRDALRMDVRATGRKADSTEPDAPAAAGAASKSPAGTSAEASKKTFAASVTHAADAPQIEFELVRGATLMAPLCTASRPVWIRIDRRALDVGPDADCAGGLPINDLRPRSLREIDLPYRAVWHGIGCFNHGVYRFELAPGTEFAIFVDDAALCVHEDEASGTRFAHACLHGEHAVRIELEDWSCRKQFKMDVYRIR